jgi:hypothetical protein
MRRLTFIRIVSAVLLGLAGCSPLSGQTPVETATSQPTSPPATVAQPTSLPPTPTIPLGSIEYRNAEFGFTFTLPTSWDGYSIVPQTWEGINAGLSGDQVIDKGPIVVIRHPAWSSASPRQDIPIMVFTLAQWESLSQDKFHIGAAPIGPSELGRNARFVFALPARYNYAFPTGFEEVDSILAGQPLQPF